MLRKQSIFFTLLIASVGIANAQAVGYNGVSTDGARGIAVTGNVATGGVATPAGAPVGTVSGKAIYVPGQPVSVTVFGAKCNWNGSTGTDDTAAFNAAWASIATKGGEIDLPTGDCYVPNGLNFSNSTPEFGNWRVIRGQGKMQSQIVTNNANIGLDLGGVTNLSLRDFMLTDVGAAPHVGLARYRPSVSKECGSHNYDGIAILGNYTLAAFYSIACEVNTAKDMDIYQYGPGVGISIDQSNCLNMTGQALAIVTAYSDTVNHFYGGTVLADQPTSGSAVMFCNGAADDVAFDGTYFDAGTGHASVLFGQTPTDNVQGSKTFHSVRFEGGGDAIQINASSVTNLTIDGGSSFSELSPGIDIDQVNTPTSMLTGSAGVVWADIHGNSHLGRGIKIGKLTSSHVSVGSLYGSSGATNATIYTIPANGFISESTVESDEFSWGSNTEQTGSVIIQNDNVRATGSYKVLYGPKSPTDPYGSGGSVIAMQPFGTPPVNPVNGELAMADGVHWKPAGVTGQTLVQWVTSASAWQVVGAAPKAGSFPTASAGTIRGTNAGGYVSGLSGVSSVTITFANSGWATWASCTANATISGSQPYVSSTLGLTTGVTFRFLSSYTGGITYSCNGN